MGAAIDLDPDAAIACRAHPLGIVDGERRRGVVVAPGQHEIHRPAVGGRIAMLGRRAGADRDMQVEEMRETGSPALSDGDGGVERGDTALGDAHHADPAGIDSRIGTEMGQRCEGVALHLGAGHQGLAQHRAAYAAAGEAVDDQGGDACVVEGLCIIMLAVTLHARAAGQDHHTGKRPIGRLRQVQARSEARRPGGGGVIEGQRVQRHRFPADAFYLVP